MGSQTNACRSATDGSCKTTSETQACPTGLSLRFRSVSRECDQTFTDGWALLMSDNMWAAPSARTLF